MFKSLNSLRFLFVSIIFIHHLSVFEAGGSCGVSFFFMLSAFVMSVGYGEKVMKHDFSYTLYLRKRLLRIYPLHCFCLLLAIPFAYKQGWSLLPNAMLMQAWFVSADIHFSANSVSWFLSSILFFYALFPAGYRFVCSLFRKKHCILPFFLCILLLYGCFLYAAPDSDANFWLYIFPVSRIPDFLFGMVAYHLYCRYASRCRQVLKPLLSSVLEVSSLCLILLECTLYYVVPSKFTFSALFLLPTFVIILVFALTSKCEGVVSKMLGSHVCQYLGSIAFAFFMVHQLCIRYVEATLRHFDTTLSWWVQAVVCFFVSLFAACVIERIMQKKRV